MIRSHAKWNEWVSSSHNRQIKTNYLTRNKEIDKLRKETTVKALRGLRKEHLPTSRDVITFFFLGVMNLFAQDTNEVSYNTEKPLDSQKRIPLLYELH